MVKGDVDLQGRSYDTFRYPDCTKCGSGPIKPSVCAMVYPGSPNRPLTSTSVFFGENISADIKIQAAEMVARSSAMVVVGSALATYSAFRLLKAAIDAGQPVCVLNLGASRADELFPPDRDSSDHSRLRIDLPATEVLTRTAAILAGEASADVDRLLLTRLLTSGVTRSVDETEPAS